MPAAPPTPSRSMPPTSRSRRASARTTARSAAAPGHVLPLRAAPGGVRQRTGHTEAAIELCRLAGKHPAAAIAELVEDGEPPGTGRAVITRAGMMRGEDNIAFARKWGLKVCTIADLVAHVEKTEGKPASAAAAATTTNIKQNGQ
ncbi:3,4-dihydroxy-2-butanone 4-phosphate synthase [Moelleriella libera RCEF 2490]|uniref:3,4-dihydroxy-2-butanone-4-phosphate synthase n=1 Tax=Moelleriella libera RCEF 2490 TaxID=1081109 RepID=A0A168DAC5_9HYPO|nr:3,4-dihydroxy-2-butanone 4-phosphate synthase [Moelleriella libera RCEF 2490]